MQPFSLWCIQFARVETKRSYVLFQHVLPPLGKGGFMKKLTKALRKQIEAIAAKKDEDIDFSDIPEVIDWSGAEIGKFYRPPKKPITIRLDMDIIEWLKASG